MSIAYSKTVPDFFTNIVRGIDCPAHEAFCTDVWVATQADNNVFQTWVEAARNPVTQLWTVVGFERMGAASGAGDAASGRRQRTLLNEACLFDALHACAGFCAAQKNIGAVPDRHANFPRAEAPHWHLVCDEAGQPRDMNTDMPYPAACGKIYNADDGFFDDAAYAIVAGTKGMALRDVSNDRQTLLPTLSTNRNLAVAADPDKWVEKKKLCSIFREALRQAERTQAALNASYQYRFVAKGALDDKIFGTAALLVTFGKSVGSDPSDSGAHPHLHVQSFLKKLITVRDKLSDELPEKSIVADFAQQAQFHYFLAQIVALQKRHVAGKVTPQDLHTKGLALVAQAALVGGMSEEETKALEVDFLAGKITHELYDFFETAWDGKQKQPLARELTVFKGKVEDQIKKWETSPV